MDFIADMSYALDLPDRLDGIFGDILAGGGRVLHVIWGHGWSGPQVEELLRRYHVRLYGRGVQGAHGDQSRVLTFHVKRKQSAWAEYILLRNGVPVTGTPVDERNAAWATPEKGEIPAWEEYEARRQGRGADGEFRVAGGGRRGGAEKKGGGFKLSDWI